MNPCIHSRYFFITLEETWGKEAKPLIPLSYPYDENYIVCWILLKYHFTHEKAANTWGDTGGQEFGNE